MKREDLEHVIRAAAAVSGCSDIVVIGRQAILAQYPDAPSALLISQETDVYPRDDPEKAIKIEGVMGEESQFHETFGYYAHGIGPETATAPVGWEARLVPVRVARALGDGEVTGWCLEPHDLVLAKCAAGRVHDRDSRVRQFTISWSSQTICSGGLPTCRSTMRAASACERCWWVSSQPPAEMSRSAGQRHRNNAKAGAGSQILPVSRSLIRRTAARSKTGTNAKGTVSTTGGKPLAKR